MSQGFKTSDVVRRDHRRRRAPPPCGRAESTDRRSKVKRRIGRSCSAVFSAAIDIHRWASALRPAVLGAAALAACGGSGDADRVLVEAAAPAPRAAAFASTASASPRGMATFDPAAVMRLNSGAEGTQPAIVMDDNGDALFVFGERNNLDAHRVFARRLDAASGQLGAQQAIDSPLGPGTASHLRLKGHANGQAIAIWTQNNSPYDPRHDVVANMYDGASRQWAGARQLTDHASQPGVTKALRPQLARGADGSAFAVWAEHRQAEAGASGSWSIHGARFNGQAWSPTEEIFRADANPIASGLYVDHPHAAVMPRGDVLVVFKFAFNVNGQGSEQIVFLRSSHVGHWVAGNPESKAGYGLPDLPPGEVQALELGTNDAGQAALVWQHQLADGSRAILASRRTAAGPWSRVLKVSGDQPLAADDSASNTYSPRVVVDAAGHATIAWHQQAAPGTSASFHALVRRLGADRVFEGPPLVLGASQQAEFNTPPALAADSRGNAFVAFTADGYSVQASRYDAASRGFGPVMRVETDDFGPNHWPQDRPPSIAMADDGTAIAVWPQFVPGEIDGPHFVGERVLFNRYQ
jgi:hypothetical protein